MRSTHKLLEAASAAAAAISSHLQHFIFRIHNEMNPPSERHTSIELPFPVTVTDRSAS